MSAVDRASEMMGLSSGYSESEPNAALLIEINSLRDQVRATGSESDKTMLAGLLELAESRGVTVPDEVRPSIDQGPQGGAAIVEVETGDAWMRRQISGAPAPTPKARGDF